VIGLLPNGVHEIMGILNPILAAAIVASVVLILSEVLHPPSSADVGRATALITRGKLSTKFWWGAILIGGLIPLALLWLAAVSPPSSIAACNLAAALALAGLFVFDDIWITAGQAPPLS